MLSTNEPVMPGPLLISYQSQARAAGQIEPLCPLLGLSEVGREPHRVCGSLGSGALFVQNLLWHALCKMRRS